MSTAIKSQARKRVRVQTDWKAACGVLIDRKGTGYAKGKQRYEDEHLIILWRSEKSFTLLLKRDKDAVTVYYKQSGRTIVIEDSGPFTGQVTRHLLSAINGLEGE